MAEKAAIQHEPSREIARKTIDAGITDVTHEPRPFGIPMNDRERKAATESLLKLRSILCGPSDD